jgi:hypothetical protein
MGVSGLAFWVAIVSKCRVAHEIAAFVVRWAVQCRECVPPASSFSGQFPEKMCIVVASCHLQVAVLVVDVCMLGQTS